MNPQAYSLQAHICPGIMNPQAFTPQTHSYQGIIYQPPFTPYIAPTHRKVRSQVMFSPVYAVETNWPDGIVRR